MSPAGARWALGLSTSICWILLAGLSTLLAASLGAAHDDPRRPMAVAIGLLPLLALMLPALPLGSWLGRGRLANRAVLLCLVAGVALPTADGWWRVGFAALAFGGASFFLVAAIGLVNRRAVAGGLVGAFVLREIMTHAGLATPGASVPARVVVAALIAAAGGWCLLRWRAAPAEERGDTFERRAGGLRLRGALALGVLFFFELSYGLGTRPALEPLAAAGSIALAAGAWLVAVRGFDVRRHRSLAVVLAVAATLGGLLPTFIADRGAVVASLLLGHVGVLLLFDRALAPVSGRRSGGNLAVGLLLLAVLSLGHAVGARLPPDQRLPVLHPAVFGAVAGVVLVAAMYLTPRPSGAPPALPGRPALAVALALPVLVAILAAV